MKLGIVGKIKIVYTSEPNSVYEVEVTPIEGKLRLGEKRSK